MQALYLTHKNIFLDDLEKNKAIEIVKEAEFCMRAEGLLLRYGSVE